MYSGTTLPPYKWQRLHIAIRMEGGRGAGLLTGLLQGTIQDVEVRWALVTKTVIRRGGVGSVFNS